MTESNLQQNQELNLHEKERGIATADQNSFVARLVNISFFLFGALELLLATRLILHLIAANPENGFATFIYGVSAPFVSLFESLLQNPTVGTNGVLEVTTVIAMIVYGILAWLVGRMVWLVLSRPR
jgi:hypothetical protein